MTEDSTSIVPIPGLDHDHPAVVRPGETAPHGLPATIPSYDGIALDQAIVEAYELRRTAISWRADPAWPRLHIVLDLALVDLEWMVEREPNNRSLAHRLQWVIHLLDLDRVLPHPPGADARKSL